MSAHVFLFVDDNKDFTLLIGLAMRGCGHEAYGVNDSRLAFDAALEIRPDVIVCDLLMPRMNGFALATRLREHAELRHALLIAGSGFATPEAEARCRAAGFDALLRKPFIHTDVLRVLETARPQPHLIGARPRGGVYHRGLAGGPDDACA